MAQAVTARELARKGLPSGTVDPNVTLPRHVRDAATRAEALQREVNGEAEPALVDGEGKPLPPQVTEPPPATEPQIGRAHV